LDWDYIKTGDSSRGRKYYVQGGEGKTDLRGGRGTKETTTRLAENTRGLSFFLAGEKEKLPSASAELLANGKRNGGGSSEKK